MKFYRVNGFTLIELMVVTAVIAILAAIAIPSYSSYVVRGSRTAAQTELLEMAGLQEKIYLNSNAYSGNVTAAYTGVAAGGLGKTAQTRDGKYNFAVAPGPASQTYIMTARPVIGKAQQGNGCLAVKEDGRRLWYEGDDGCTAASPKPW